MATFNLSLVASRAPAGDIQASPNYQMKTNPNTGEQEKQEVGKDGVSIDKSLAPRLVLDGAVGHTYTALLNKELSLESMGAIVAAASMDVEDTANHDEDTGHVKINSQGAEIETSNPNAGYIYVVDADTLESAALGSISSKILDRMSTHPNEKIGLAMISNGKPTATVESLTRCFKSSKVMITYHQAGLVSMAQDMLKGN